MKRYDCPFSSGHDYIEIACDGQPDSIARPEEAVGGYIETAQPNAMIDVPHIPRYSQYDIPSPRLKIEDSSSSSQHPESAPETAYNRQSDTNARPKEAAAANVETAQKTATQDIPLLSSTVEAPSASSDNPNTRRKRPCSCSRGDDKAVKSRRLPDQRQWWQKNCQENATLIQKTDGSLGIDKSRRKDREREVKETRSTLDSWIIPMTTTTETSDMTSGSQMAAD